MFEIDKYTQIEIEEYNGTFSVVQGFRGNDGFKPRWVKEEFGKGNEKNVPKRIALGNRDRAIEALKYMLGELDGTPF